MSQDFFLIGIDGGATKVSAWQVVADDSAHGFRLGQLHAEKSYKEIPGFIEDFKPVAITTQLKEFEQKSIRPTADEEQQGAVYIEACAQVVETIAGRSGTKPLILGIGMPGIKTPDKRGIAVVANGPRMLNYAQNLEERLALKHLRLAQPVSHLGSDADYCGIGENYAADGLFSGVQNAYYLGGGTGVADALKLKGLLLPLDQTKTWLAKTWEMKNARGISLERFASAGGIQSLYAERCGKEISVLNEEGIYPLQIAELALNGSDQAARHTMEDVALNIADLLFERIVTLHSGWQNSFAFVNPNRPALSGNHPYLGGLFERIIIGQRLGQLFDSAAGSKTVRQPVLNRLDRLLAASALPQEAKRHYAKLDTIIVTSRLREAPALGAGIDAILNRTP